MPILLSLFFIVIFIFFHISAMSKCHPMSYYRRLGDRVLKMAQDLEDSRRLPNRLILSLTVLQLLTPGEPFLSNDALTYLLNHPISSRPYPVFTHIARDMAPLVADRVKRRRENKISQNESICIEVSDVQIPLTNVLCGMQLPVFDPSTVHVWF